MSIESLGNNLIFIISQPRSGSTLLQLMLSRNSEIATTSEPWIALHPIFALHDGAVDPNYDANQARNALLEFLKESGVDVRFYKQQIGIFLNNLYDQSRRHQGKKFFLDKTPRYYNVIEDLYDIFPNAKFIILLRNPLAVLNSVLKTWVKDDDTLLLNNYEDLMIAPVKLVNFLKQNRPGCLRIQFEDLVSNPTKIIQDICAFIGIEYSDDMIHYGTQQMPGWKFGDQTGIHQFSSPEITSSQKWQTEFNNPREKRLALSYLDSLDKKVIQGMGYNYNKLRSTISQSPEASDEKAISWMSLTKVINIFSSIRDIRRMVLQILLDTRDSDNEPNWPLVWQKHLQNLVQTIIVPKLEAYQLEYKKEMKKNDLLEKKIDQMQNSLSWRMTAPLRNSRILKQIMKNFKNNEY